MTPLALDAAYAIAALVTAPWWARKARAGWAERFGRLDPLPPPAAGRPRLLIHAVSVGEVGLIAPLIDRLAGDLDLVVSATTDTGLARARQLYDDRAHVVRYPLDASWSVRRFLDAVRPDAAALVELELWPNFTSACARRAVPIAVINGRLSPRSFRRYRLARPLVGPMFRRLEFAAVQDEAYAERFIEMGVPPERCIVAGTMKWDAAEAQPAPGAPEALAEAMGLDRTAPLVVAGSTAPDEHALLRAAVAHAERELRRKVQLLCAPRKPEWFDAAAADLPGCVRRSRPGSGDPSSGLFVLDTIGELTNAYALADLVVVGRSFGGLHGSDPMQPAALSKPVVIGPAVRDFQQSVDALRDDWAVVQTTRDGLADALTLLLRDERRRAFLATAARRCVERHRGASAKHAELLTTLLAGRP